MPEIVWPEGWTYSIVHWGEYQITRRTTADDPAWGRISTEGTRYDGSRVNGDPHIYASEPDVSKDIYSRDKAALICALLNERDHDKIDPAWLRQRAGDFEWRP